MSERTHILEAGLAKLYESGQYSDFTIICGPYHFKVHRAIIASQSEYFKIACDRSKFKEGETGSIDFKATQKGGDDDGDDPDIVKIMVEYFYKLTYGDDEVKSAQPAKEKEVAGPGANPTSKPISRLISSYVQPTRTNSALGGAKPATNDAQHKTAANHGDTGDSDLVLHAKVYAIAVKYQVPGLESLATRKFETAVAKDWDSPDFAIAITQVCSSTPEESATLREIVIQTLLAHETLDDKPEVEAAIYASESLGFQLYKRNKDATRDRSKIDRGRFTAGASYVLDLLQSQPEGIGYYDLENWFTTNGYGGSAAFDSVIKEVWVDDVVQFDTVSYVCRLTAKKRRMA